MRARPVNRYDRMEWAGAFGDLGTLIPFVVGYVGVLGMDPQGILLPMGLAMLASGLFFRTPVPVQPMKVAAAIAITQAAQGLVVTPDMVVAASLVTGALWLLFGLSGLAARLAALMPASAVIGIVLGLGVGFMLDGLHRMASHWALAGAGLVGTLALLRSRRVPAMLILLAFGGVSGALLDPAGVERLLAGPPDWRLPGLALDGLSWDNLAAGAMFLALPQLPLTLGNALVAIRDENNRLFPDRPVTARQIALSTGLMNLFGASLGGVPMCHGAGGMAAHMAFGARTGGALVILGGLLTVLSLGFSTSAAVLFGLFTPAILGVMLLIAGGQLARAARHTGPDWRSRLVVGLTATLALWNVGLACLVGVAAAACLRPGAYRPRR